MVRFRRARYALMVCVGFMAAGCGRSTHNTPGGPAVTRVGGLDFVAVPARVRQECRRVARAVGYPVLCPTQLPRHATATSTHGDSACKRPATLIDNGCLAPHTSRWVFSSLESPYPWDTNPSPAFHVVLQSVNTVMGPQRSIYGGYTGEAHDPAGYRETRLGARVQIGHGVTGRFVLVDSAPASALVGHAVLVWNQDGHTYGIGFHGLDAASQQRTIYLARHTTLTPP